MLRRVLTRLFVIVSGLALLTFLIILLIAHGEAVVHALQSEQNIVSLVLALLQPLGIIVLFVILLYILIQYIKYIRSHRFIFDGFSNTSRLIAIEEMPIELTMLARERLVHQVKVLYSQWGKFVCAEKPDAKERSESKRPDAEALITDELYFGQTPSAQNLERYISSEMTRDNEATEHLRKVINTLMDSEGINLMDLAGEIAPKEVTPIMKFIEAVVPPRAVRATGHLQWWDEKAKRAGITFEFVDLSSRRSLMVRTIWYPSRPGQEDQKQTSLPGDDEKSLAAPGDDEKSLAAKHYIELLEPTMHWLALMFWEQRMKAHIRRFRGGKRQLAQLLHLFGSLYNASASAKQFSDYEVFFRQLAIEHFREAISKDKEWYAPYLYLGNLYSMKAQKMESEMRQKMLSEALELFGKALKYAKRAKEGPATEQRIILAQALAEQAIAPGSGEHAAEIYRNKIEGVKAVIEADGFDFEQADRAGFLYNLALWYGVSRANGASIRIVSGTSILDINARTEARLYLAYSLALSEYLREEVEREKTFGFLRERGDLAHLKEELSQHQNLISAKERERTKMTGLIFKAEIKKILEKIDKDLQRSGG
jgi:hypothetical protein